ncbi:MAG: response regulator, partial [Hungatella sp.]
MRIAICDDSQQDIEYLKKLIIESKFLEKKAEFYEFHTGEQLLEKFNKFELIFLDIKLKGVSGIQVAKSIRLQDPGVAIVFYSNYDVLASKVVKTNPIHYLIKGSSLEEQKTIIDSILHRVFDQEESKGLPVMYAGKMFMLSLSDIIYISILDKGTAIWLSDERRFVIFGELKKNQNPLDLTIRSGVKLETYYEQLKIYGFI